MIIIKGSTRYITSMGSLKRKDNSIVFRNENGNVYIPIEGVKEIYCLNEITITTKLLDFISKAGIVIHFFNYYGYYSGSFYPRKQLISGKLTVEQSKIYLNNRMIVAKAIIKGIAVNMHEVLYHYYKHGKKDIKNNLDWMKKDINKLIDREINIKQLLSIEGELWQRFYECFPIILNKDFVFNKRVKRPPDNPLNALISFGNTLLYAKTISQIYHTHLNQAISFLHEPSEGRFSLSLDVSEVFKPIIVYKTIFDVVNNRKLRVNKHFNRKVNYCILNEKGRKKFIVEFEERINGVFYHKKLKRKTSYLNAIKLDAYKLIKYILEGKDFIPFSLKEKI